MSNDEFVKIQVPLPPLEVQRRIAADIEQQRKVVAKAKESLDKAMRSTLEDVWGEDSELVDAVEVAED